MGGKACWQALQTDGCWLQPSAAMNPWALKTYSDKHKKLCSEALGPLASQGPLLDLSLVICKERIWMRRFVLVSPNLTIA